MLLGDADVEITLGKTLGEFHHARAFAHRRCDADQARVLLRHVAQPVAEYLRVAWFAAALTADDAVAGLELRHAVIEHGVGFGEFVALALARDDVQKLRAFETANIAQ